MTTMQNDRKSTIMQNDMKNIVTLRPLTASGVGPSPWRMIQRGHDRTGTLTVQPTAYGHQAVLRGHFGITEARWTVAVWDVGRGGKNVQVTLDQANDAETWCQLSCGAGSNILDIIATAGGVCLAQRVLLQAE